jgi:hypothetical protein
MVAAPSKVKCNYTGKYREKVRFEVIYKDRQIVAVRFLSKSHTEVFG